MNGSYLPLTLMEIAHELCADEALGFGSTLAASTKQVVQSCLKPSIQCIDGMRTQASATYILKIPLGTSTSIDLVVPACFPYLKGVDG